MFLRQHSSHCEFACVVYVMWRQFCCLDEHRLSDYSIGPEAKLNLVVRPAGERSSGAGGTSSCNNEKAGSGVWQLLSTVLAKHFSPADAAKVQEQLTKVCIAMFSTWYSVTLAIHLSFSFECLLWCSLFIYPYGRILVLILFLGSTRIELVFHCSKEHVHFVLCSG